MAEEHKLSGDLADFENAMRDLAPASPQLDLAQTLYLAGQQAGRHERKSSTFWPLCSACLAVACVTLGMLLARPSETRIVYVPSPVKTPESDKAIGRPAGSHSDEPARDGDSDRPSGTRSPSSLPSATSLVARSNQDLEELLDQMLSNSQRQPSLSGKSESPVIATLYSSDWPALVPDQSAGERFRSLTTPLRQPSTETLQRLTALFSIEGT